MNKYLLEIGVEELPSRFCAMAMNQLEQKATKLLKDYELDYGELKVYATPRRLSLIIEDIATAQADVDTEVKGPALKISFDENHAPTKPLQGFMKSQNVTESDIFTKELKGTEYIYARIHKKGATLDTVIAENMAELIKSINFPKNMRWGGKAIKFARPIRWVVSMLNDKVLPFDFEGISVGNVTYGHRFLGGRVDIDHVDNYEALLEKNYVILDQDKRRDSIKFDSLKLAKSVNGDIHDDDALLEELTYIVEYPTPLLGEIKEKYLNLPKEVITTPMRDHLRYIPVYGVNDELLPYFITVRNGGKDHADVVIAGNLKVLEARLEDAVFFYDDDISKPLENYTEALSGLMFHEKLGTMADKTARLEKLSIKIAEELQLGDTTREHLERAANLAKADLTTKLVQEFTELQGVMGAIYAEKSGEPSIVAQAIDEQYKPRFSGDALPSSTVGSVLAIADKLDSITGMFAVGLIPTGSQDPFALRRQAIGIINIIMEKKWALSMAELIDTALFIYTDSLGLVFDYDAVKTAIIDFFKGRMKTMMNDEGIRYDIIDAVMDTEGSIYDIITKGRVFTDYFTDERKTFVDSFTRIKNITTKNMAAATFDDALLKEPEEKALYEAVTEVLPEVDDATEGKNFADALDKLSRLEGPITDFFDHVLVLDKDEVLKNNRLALLESLDRTVSKLLDIGKLVIS